MLGLVLGGVLGGVLGWVFEMRILSVYRDFWRFGVGVSNYSSYAPQLWEL